MKSYEINYAAKVATITKKTTAAEKRMLERMGLKLELKKERARPSYKQIEIFLSYLDNGLEMMEEFELAEAQVQQNVNVRIILFHLFFIFYKLLHNSRIVQ